MTNSDVSSKVWLCGSFGPLDIIQIFLNDDRNVVFTIVCIEIERLVIF